MKILNFSFPTHTKHRFFSVFVALSCICLSVQLTADDGAKHQVKVTNDKDSLIAFAGNYEHKGIVTVDNAGQDEDAQRLRLDVNARINFDQRYTGNQEKNQAIRQYRDSRADIVIDKNKTKSFLKDTNQLIVTRINERSSQRLQVASINDVLKQSELDLIRNPADPLTYAGVFDKTEIKIGDTWKAESDALADFLAVDHVYQNDVLFKLTSVNGDIAKLYIIGNAKAEIDDVTTEMEVSGVALINTARQHLRALRATIVENRSPGQIAPGFQGETKIDVKMSPLESVKELSNQALAQAASKKIDRRIKWEGKDIEVTFDPRWRIIASEKDAAVFRYVDQGLLLAQCNIVQLPSRKPNNPLGLDTFCLLYTSPSPRDATLSRMPSSA